MRNYPAPFEDYMGGDDGNMNIVARKLRELPEIDRFIYVKKVIEYDTVIGVKLSNRVLSDKCYLRCLFADGIKDASPRTIKFWVKVSLPRLGEKATLQILRRCGEETYEKVLKFFPVLAKKVGL